MLYSWSDNRKKSALMLSVFEPNLFISWLGDVKNLGPSAEVSKNPYQYDQKEDAEETPFPIAPNRRRSYHLQPNVVWVKNAGLQVRSFQIQQFSLFLELSFLKSLSITNTSQCKLSLT